MCLQVSSSGNAELLRELGLAMSLIPIERNRFRKEKMRELSSLISSLRPELDDKGGRIEKMSKTSIQFGKRKHELGVLPPALSLTVSKGLSERAESSAK